MTDRVNPKIGLRLETAAGLILRDLITDHMAKFQFVIRTDRAAGLAVVAAYVDGLAGAMALVVAGGQVSKQEIADIVSKVLVEALERDLRHLKRD